MSYWLENRRNDPTSNARFRYAGKVSESFHELAGVGVTQRRAWRPALALVEQRAGALRRGIS